MLALLRALLHECGTLPLPLQLLDRSRVHMVSLVLRGRNGTAAPRDHAFVGATAAKGICQLELHHALEPFRLSARAICVWLSDEIRRKGWDHVPDVLFVRGLTADDFDDLLQTQGSLVEEVQGDDD